MAQFKIVVNTETGTEEEHLFETCGRCGSEIDNSLDGFYGHKNHPGLVLCAHCYQELVSGGKWKADKIAAADLVKK